MEKFMNESTEWGKKLMTVRKVSNLNWRPAWLAGVAISGMEQKKSQRRRKVVTICGPRDAVVFIESEA